MAQPLATAPLPLKTDPLAVESFTREAFLRSMLSLAGGFLFAALLLRLLIGDPLQLYAPDRSEKQSMLANMGKSIPTTAAFGSSLTHLGLDPRTLDSGLAGSGIAGRSVNLGLSAGAKSEERVMGLYWLRHLPQSSTPCMIITELNAPSTFSLQWMTHPREINEFDWTSARIAAMYPADPGSTTLRMWHVRLASGISLTAHYLNTGMLSNKIFRPNLSSDYKLETQDDRRGLYTPPVANVNVTWIAGILAGRPPHAEVVNAQLAEGDRKILNDLQTAAPGTPIRFVEVIMPVLYDLYRTDTYPASSQTSVGVVPIIDLGRPDLYPQFYAANLWLDPQHLNEAGAQLVTKELARQIQQWYGTHPPQPNPGCRG